MGIPDVLTLKFNATKNEVGKNTGQINIPNMGFVPLFYNARSVAHNYADKEWDISWDFPDGRDAFYGSMASVNLP